MEYKQIPKHSADAKWTHLTQEVLNKTPEGHWLWPRTTRVPPVVSFQGIEGNMVVVKFLWLYSGHKHKPMQSLVPICDNPLCLNPDHIEIADWERGNRGCGPKRPYAKKPAPQPEQLKIEPKAVSIRQDPIVEPIEEKIIKHHLPNGNYVHLNIATKAITTDASTKQLTTFLSQSYRINDTLYMPEIIRHYYRIEFEIDVTKTSGCWEYTGPEKRHFKPADVYMHYQRRATFLYKMTNRIGTHFHLMCNNPKCVNPAHIVMNGDRPFIEDKASKAYIDSHMTITYKKASLLQRIKNIFH